MPAPAKIDLTALADSRRVLNLWRSIIAAGLVFFGVLLVLSYFALNASSVANDALRYKRVEATLGFSEFAALAVSIIALLRYINLRAKYRERVFKQLTSDNGWSHIRKFNMDIVAGILLGTGTPYEQNYGFSGTHNGQKFTCLIFQFVAANSRSCHYICLNFKLPKSYPMIVIDNKFNDHGFRSQNSNLPEHIPGGVSIGLEGDFYKYYRVNTNKDREQEAVHVLSPDFMADLIDQANNKVDIEISGKNLFLIYEDEFYTEHNIKALFTVADVALSKLTKLSKTWLASGKAEENAIAQTVHATRHKLIAKLDYIGAAFSLLLLIFLIVAALT